MGVAPGEVTRFETLWFGFFLACWTVDLLVFLRVVTVAGSLTLSLYGLYSAAMSLGWLGGFLYMRRSRGLPDPLRRRVFWLYLAGPPGLIYLLRNLATFEVQQQAPLAILYAFGVYSIFFWVPIKFPVDPGRLR
ncbi:MAG TPA: hypothetical protein VMW27_30250 [Thermoanaerobaculia bacterium]|nr:hypothetical protein [Thermoanaerobaculia bacterium]